VSREARAARESHGGLEVSGVDSAVVGSKKTERKWAGVGMWVEGSKPWLLREGGGVVGVMVMTTDEGRFAASQASATSVGPHAIATRRSSTFLLRGTGCHLR